MAVSAEAGRTTELAVSSLTVRFGALTALDDVNLTVGAGEVVALAGENGAGKTTLIRAIGGDITPATGSIRLGGRTVAPNPTAAAKLGIRIVWQDLALSDNLDVASTLMLGNERRRHLLSEVSLHNEAARVLAMLGIPPLDTTRPVSSLSGGQRQMVAVARAMAHNPRLLMLDEPTASLGGREAALVERLITRLRSQGTTILLSGHDMELIFRLADRIVVLRHGRVVTEVSPSEVRPDDVMALVSGQPVDSSARRQLTRLHGLAGRLVSSDPSSSLSAILSALGAALGSERLCIHLCAPGDGSGARPGHAAATADGPAELVCTASFGVPDPLLSAWERLPSGAAGGPVGLAAERQEPVIEDNIRVTAGSWAVFGNLTRMSRVASSWSVPVLGPGGGLLGVITVLRAITGKPRRDDLDLATLYAGYAASAIERDRLLDQVTARNRLLETIREVLQTLAGPVPVADGLGTALDALRHGLNADEAALVTAERGGTAAVRAYSGSAPGSPWGDAGPAGGPGGHPPGLDPGADAAEGEPGGAESEAGLTGTDPADPADGMDSLDGADLADPAGGRPGGQSALDVRHRIPAATLAAAVAALRRPCPEDVALAADAGGTAEQDPAETGDRHLAVTFGTPDGRTVLLARWADGTRSDDATALLEDAAHSLRMALERERALAAQQEAMALRQSRELQQAFLRRLSHELRTPLTAITGYATSLLQQDVTWDVESQQRFLSRISAESARLGRLVNDLLDFSAIESGTFRLQRDWCDIPLVLDAAVAVLPRDAASRVEVKATPGLPAVWADHDRLEQVFVNLIGNALGHNPPQTRVTVTAETVTPSAVTVRVTDDGEGLPPELARAVTEAAHGHDPRWHDVLASGTVRPRSWRRGSGAGLGLSIASGIVTAHGGRIELETASRGTSFLVTLPVERLAERPSDNPVAQTPRREGT